MNIVEKKIVGAFMEVYLLEKSRVCMITKDERDYHIFYQMEQTRLIQNVHHLIHN